MKEQPMKFSNEDLSTLMCEVEAILNNRPLTELSSDPTDMEALTPNHILLGRSGQGLPPGVFTKDDYLRSKWRQVQHLANLFWKRWRREYLPLLQERQKWTTTSTEPFQVGDLVLIMDQVLPRNQWVLGRVHEVFPSRDGVVRKLKIKVAKHRNANLNQFGCTSLLRPATSVILLKSNEKLISCAHK